MADRKSFFYKQDVQDDDLNSAFDGLENADRAIVADLGLTGIIAEAVISQHSPSANLTVDASGGAIVYDQLGERITWSSTQNIDVSKDYNAITTAVAASGNEKWVSIFVQFERVLTDPQTDGNSNTVYFDQDEGFSFYVVQGTEATIDTATRPTLQADMILLADVHMTYGLTAVTSSNLDTTRRQIWIDYGFVNRGRVIDAIKDVIDRHNGLVLGTGDQLLANETTLSASTSMDNGADPDNTLSIGGSPPFDYALAVPDVCQGRRIRFIDKTGILGPASAVTLVRNGSEKINNLAASYLLQIPHAQYELYCDGTNWFISQI